ncbi:hypothetical protein PF005_g11361 [Phytophthora fragariae]|uniref:Uncharacterized protein n=1 Tax=Phytophthora fragariae TaxID=53985 RepID=A0A6A3ZPL9_9STRA|nr:hypothetical protein PF003_g39284 [Phytophthora fragariae]KAE8937351.1 hypothetical protein PF009_g12739 [Phytophthora fragariae]KAE9109592.1 hypothetical protein PF007_g12184 [Phytophthora fragariae]KAE9144338.1 hypothetical protein PF006_g10715 [Phytophthora fragariae]KAE9210565.1 hypothetical protein PF005_g11361 [Phytophthora fragariae]
MILDWRGPRRQRAARASSEIRTPGRRRLRLAVGEGLPLKQVGACNLPFGQKSRECNRFLARVADMKVGRRPASTTAPPMLRARPAADGDAGMGRPKYLLVPRYRGGQGRRISLGGSTRLRGGPARQGNAARVAEPGRVCRAGGATAGAGSGAWRQSRIGSHSRLGLGRLGAVPEHRSHSGLDGHPRRQAAEQAATTEAAARRVSMTLKCWNAGPPRKVPAIDTSAGVESLLAGNQAGRPRVTPKSARCRSQSSNWDKDAVDAAGDIEDDHFDVTAATIPAPSHQIHAMPALWVSGRRRHSRGRSRRRTVSENYNHGLVGSSNGANAAYGNNSTPTGSSSSSLSATLPSSFSGGDEQLRQAAAAAAAGGSLNERLRITIPDGPRFAGWVRGQAAEVQWDALDPSVQCVRIDVCNVAWTVPTTIAHRVPNDGTFRWRRVYWGMPIAEGYYVNIYDATEQKDAADLLLLAQSERFAVIK